MRWNFCSCIMSHAAECKIDCVCYVQRQLLEQIMSMGAVDRAADELVELLESSMSDISQLGSVYGDEHLIAASLHHLQVCFKHIAVYLGQLSLTSLRNWWMRTSFLWVGKSRYGLFHLLINTWVHRYNYWSPDMCHTEHFYDDVH